MIIELPLLLLEKLKVFVNYNDDFVDDFDLLHVFDHPWILRLLKLVLLDFLLDFASDSVEIVH